MIGGDPLPDRPFDTAGEREVEVGELAELAIATVGRPTIAVERPPMVRTGIDRYVGDGSEMDTLASAYDLDLKGLPDQILDTARFLGI